MPLPAGPKAHLITGHLAAFRADRLGFFTHCARTYGDVVPLRIVYRRALLISRPDLIEQVLVTQAKNFVKHFGLRMYKPILGDGLVTSEGDFWRRQRKLAAPAFQPVRLAGYVPDIVNSAERMVEAWRDEAAGAERAAGSGRSGGVRDIHDDLMRLTLEIACKTLFGAEGCPNPDAVGRAMNEGLRAIAVRFGRLAPVPEWFPAPSNLRLRRALRMIDGVVTRVIERNRGTDGENGPAARPGRHAPALIAHSAVDAQDGPAAHAAGVIARSADGEDGPAARPGRHAPAQNGHAPANDLLSLLLRSRDEGGSAMTDDQLRDEVRTLLLAGHETTALALTYSFYLLAEHPDCQAALQAELTVVLGGRPPAFDDLPRLGYARKVVAEALRLYPPADVLGREAIIDCSVGGTVVKKGVTLFMSTWVMHRDPRYFHDPEAFDPGRWTEEFERSLPRFAYFPFGGGPRYCIGQAFATAEAVLVLASLCQCFHFDPDPAFKLELWPSITLRPKAGVRVVVRNRE